MSLSDQEKFIEKVSELIDRWNCEQCAYCNDGTLVSIDGMLDFKCSKCGRTMNPLNYLREIANIVLKYREKKTNPGKNNETSE
ncbi:MAG: hypothetical protein ACFFCI_25065 [Promethearchaeota archaeon]